MPGRVLGDGAQWGAEQTHEASHSHKDPEMRAGLGASEEEMGAGSHAKKVGP